MARRVLPFSIARTVSISVGDEIETQKAGEIGFRRSHKIFAAHVRVFTVQEVPRIVLQS